MIDIAPFGPRDDAAELRTLMVATYRAAYATDMSAVHLDHHLAHALSDQKVEAMIEADRFWTASDGGGYVAYVQLGAASNDVYPGALPGDLAIRRAYVEAAHQGRGLGTRLLNVALDAAAEETKRVFIDVWETNRRARALYERLGFRLVGEQPEYDPSGEMTGVDYILLKRL